MSALIVGGDRIHSYKEYLSEQGFAPVRHWNGRRHSECHRELPIDTRLVVVMVDQINHGLALKMRRLAAARDLPVVYCRRSLGQLCEGIANLRCAERACEPRNSN